MVGWVGGFLETMPTTSFWLMHAGFAAVSGAAFLLFKLFLSKRLMEREPAPLPD
jgi:POT family proton-dependent oligopeptide transporter